LETIGRSAERVRNIDFCDGGMSSRKILGDATACSSERETLLGLLWFVGLDWHHDEPECRR
jgi:hypothetical protein